ncbi:diguanylate cyclase (GGDEF)-like protein/PAS domain S-box-containing protein [Acetoanaerobium pronyense]|uniref:Diguanylate cyclase (GGDEF)-like protein/PAS domain S-box-containing protein n=1 Tax=Acetoanaerobium pronyense TaxID=1482736 RepID=A0ABS4KGI5_9FIRM|nr:EAL domain-containing protein [Acetoanaerobium pronyense]MBP2026889.1 diguanylate cyclase (GGDEF)-like protein/PAS domain S-box-containing protein [Acetoanaerobium pronyense]
MYIKKADILSGDTFLFEAVFQAMKDGIIITDNKFKIIWGNLSAQRITGIKIDDMKGKSPRDIKTGLLDEELFKDIWTSLMVYERWEGEIWSKHRNGKKYPEKLTIFTVKDKSDKEIERYVLIFEDLTLRKKIRQRLKVFSQRDSLTGLCNRNGFEINLQKKLSDYRGDFIFALILVDIVNFKEMNDSLGQNIGDEILKKCAVILKENFKSGFLIGRYGSDEFIIATPRLKYENKIFELTKEIRKKLEAPIKIDDIEVNILVRQGVAFYPLDGIDVDILIRNTNIASFYSKEMQNALVFYDKKMEDEMIKSFFIANNIKRGIDEGEFYLMYQPIFDINGKKLAGLEALARWQNKDIGLINPMDFISIAEKTGNINLLGDFILKEVSKDIVKWKDAGIDIPKVAINISTKQLEHQDFCFNALSIFEYYGVNLFKIEFEITESIMMGNIKIILENINYLNGAGISMSIDDFGTGYSSLGQLKNLPIKKIKIDKIFIDDIPYDSKGVEICRSILSMGRILKLDIVAEGIETKEQLEAIKRMGCILGQGYYYSKPLEPHEIQNSFL